MFAIVGSQLFVIQPDNDNDYKLFCAEIHCNDNCLKTDKFKLCHLSPEFSENIKSFHTTNLGTIFLTTFSGKSYHLNPRTDNLSVFNKEHQRFIIRCGNVNFFQSPTSIPIFHFSVLTSNNTFIVSTININDTNWVETDSNMVDCLASHQKGSYMTLTQDEILTVHFSRNKKLIKTPFGVKKILYVNNYYFYLDNEGYLFKISLEGKRKFVAKCVENIFRTDGILLPFITFDKEFCVLDPDMITLFVVKKFDFDIIDLHFSGNYYCYTDEQGQLFLSMIKSDLVCQIKTIEPLFCHQDRYKKRIKNSLS